MLRNFLLKIDEWIRRYFIAVFVVLGLIYFIIASYFIFSSYLYWEEERNWKIEGLSGLTRIEQDAKLQRDSIMANQYKIIRHQDSIIFNQDIMIQNLSKPPGRKK